MYVAGEIFSTTFDLNAVSNLISDRGEDLSGLFY